MNLSFNNGTMVIEIESETEQKVVQKMLATGNASGIKFKDFASMYLEVMGDVKITLPEKEQIGG
jgi:hypothetical protein